jgi:hypothetical protein
MIGSDTAIRKSAAPVPCGGLPPILHQIASRSDQNSSRLIFLLAALPVFLRGGPTREYQLKLASWLHLMDDP